MSTTSCEENAPTTESCVDIQNSPDMAGECSRTKCDEMDESFETSSGSSSSKFEIVNVDIDSSSCSSCSTRRNSFCSVTSDSELETSLSNLFHTPSTTSTTSHSSHLGTPNTNDRRSATPILDGVDMLLQRLTSERFAELRNIQLSERPVTGGGARDNIESFMRRAVHGPTEEEQRLEELANRPEHVESEVQFLQQRSVVQSSLTNDFRSVLEQALLSRISSTPRQSSSVRNNTQQDRDLVGGNGFRQRLEALFGERISSTTPSRRVPNNPPRQRRRSFTRPTHVPALPTVAPPTLTPPPAPAPVLDQTPRAEARFTIDAGMQLLAQSIADDLDRLQSLHVVSGMLRGDFRREMETLVQSRIQDEQSAEETAQYIRSLPGRRPDSQPTQNHHRHPHGVPVVGTPTQSQTAINASVSAEISSLTRQLEEMKRMLAMSMEIQMDTQRAVRQEVAGIFNTFAQTYGINAAQTPAPQRPTLNQTVSTPVSAGQCVICLDRNVDAVLYQCGHMCTCNQCGMQLKMNGHNCPMCRAPIRDVIRAYQTQS